ncbi:YkuS family protein [Caldisalinibacter kiritimatiensis]|uniref:YkuS family protein n=1 Tax=Caldisalinibacter kiritimatiensis TaxID=1304284 RepID=R1AX35_9FIRM|nr:YkuS family protein [Caldisalinibacter kiritimatiensis]EOD01227.1 hypothetical protein L21TH_0703 [Caldisalinibacter kiritimatiensis]
MENKKIAVQRGLNKIIELLKKEGYDVVLYEENKEDVDITIVSGIDSEYEETEYAQCRVYGDKKMLLIDASKLDLETVLRYVKDIKC